MLQGKACYWPAVSYGITSTQAKKKTAPFAPWLLPLIRQGEWPPGKALKMGRLTERAKLSSSRWPRLMPRQARELSRTIRHPSSAFWHSRKRKRCCDDLMWGVDREGKCVHRRKEWGWWTPETCVREHREKSIPVRPDTGWSLSTSASSMKLLKGLYLVYSWASEKHSILLVSVEMGW